MKPVWCWLTLCVSLMGCTIVTPPPIVPAHAVSKPMGEGMTSISLVAGVGAGVWIDRGYGFELRLSHQFTNRLSIGTGLGFVMAVDRLEYRKKRKQRCLASEAEAKQGHQLFLITCDMDEPTPDFLFATRLLGTFIPHRASDWLAVPFGAGFGLSDTGMKYLTLQTGVRLSTVDGSFDAYAQPTIALSVPLDSGPRIKEKEVPTTIWVGMSMGGVGDSDGRISGSGDISGMFGLAPDAGLLLLATGAATYELEE